MTRSAITRTLARSSVALTLICLFAATVAPLALLAQATEPIGPAAGEPSAGELSDMAALLLMFALVALAMVVAAFAVRMVRQSH